MTEQTRAPAFVASDPKPNRTNAEARALRALIHRHSFDLPRPIAFVVDPQSGDEGEQAVRGARSDAFNRDQEARDRAPRPMLIIRHSKSSNRSCSIALG